MIIIERIPCNDKHSKTDILIKWIKVANSANKRKYDTLLNYTSIHDVYGVNEL